MDIEKALDSLDHNFLISDLKKYAFSQNFILWVKILLKDQEKTKYFLLGRGARHVNPISAFLFILVSQILLFLINTKPEIAGLTIFNHCYVYPEYADNATFFLNDTISVKHMVDAFHFLYFSRLNQTYQKVRLQVLKF